MYEFEVQGVGVCANDVRLNGQILLMSAEMPPTDPDTNIDPDKDPDPDNKKQTTNNDTKVERHR
jgi:hypothetical protein